MHAQCTYNSTTNQWLSDEGPTTLLVPLLPGLMDGPPSHTPPGVGGRAKMREVEGGWGRENTIC